jgi:hypothetical protein
MHELMGLYLLFLLSQNRIGEFHTELERLDPALLPVGQGEGNIYISYPVHLEQYLMEGSYNKVFLLKENVPADAYKFFVEELLLTLREEIAEGIEKAYVVATLHPPLTPRRLLKVVRRLACVRGRYRCALCDKPQLALDIYRRMRRQQCDDKSSCACVVWAAVNSRCLAKQHAWLRLSQPPEH